MNNIKFLGISLIVLLFSACSDSFLDADTNEFLTKSKIDTLKTDSQTASLIVDGALNGVYSTLIDYKLNGNTRHDYFGLKSIHLATDLMGLDINQVTHHWMGYDYNIGNRLEGYSRTRLVWAFFYKMVSSTNIILSDYLPQEIKEDGVKALKAKTTALRGIAYYYLINLYQQTYKGNEDKPGVPLILLPTDKNKPRAKVSEVYKQIIEDLTYGVKYGVVTETKKDADKLVAAAFLAKAYAHTEQWDSVAHYANIAIKDAVLVSGTTLEGGMGDISSSEWLWGADINAVTNTSYASFYSMADNTIGGYAGALGVYKSIYSNLYDKIDDKDSRKNIFVDSVRNPKVANKYFDQLVAKDSKYISLKYQTKGDFTGDYCFIRVADPYLLLAEAYVEKGELSKAQTTLQSIIETRNSDYNAASFNSIPLMREEVRLQRRIELWCEGTSLFDVKRWKVDMIRSAVGSNHRTKKDIAAGAVDYVYQIPRSEMDANPNIGEQNP